MRTLGKRQGTIATVSSAIVKRSFGTTSSDYNSALENCTALVKQHDFDNYLAGLLLPKIHRAPYFAVRAFHVEIALIKDQSRGNALSGRMRFQFWRDSIDQVFAQKDSISIQTPVAIALHHHVDNFSQSHRFFTRALDARCPKFKSLLLCDQGWHDSLFRNQCWAGSKSWIFNSTRRSRNWRISQKMPILRFCTFFWKYLASKTKTCLMLRVMSVCVQGSQLNYVGWHLWPARCRHCSAVNADVMSTRWNLICDAIRFLP